MAPRSRPATSGVRRQSGVEFGGNRVQVAPQGVGVPGGDQDAQPVARCSNGVAQRARPTPAGVICSGGLERGQPILEGGDPARPDGPAARGLIQRCRSPQIRDQ